MTPKQIEQSTPSDLLLHLLNPFFFLPLSFVGFPGSQACHWAAHMARHLGSYAKLTPVKHLLSYAKLL
jgi:hypothetical protein